jgi:hypothetical protein
MTMRTDVIIVDNFYDDPWAVRDYALKQEYYYPYEQAADVEAGRARWTWAASRFRPADECPFKSSGELVARLAEVTGEEVDLRHWRADCPTDDESRPARNLDAYPDRGCVWNCCFHCKPDNGQRLGDGVHNHVTDKWNGVGPDGWAGLIYLSEDAPLGGGLKLWRNRDEAHRFDWMTPAENWELIDDVGNVPNRLILARGDLPHSGAGGWGTTLESGRLYQTFFFRTLTPRTRESLVIPL